MIPVYLKKGDVIELKNGMTVYSGISTSLKKTAGTDIPAGEYAVIEAGSTGQGSGYDGSVDAAVIYPDGYKVVCKKMKDGKYDGEGTEIHFYQSGCFSVVIQPHQIQAVRKTDL